MKNNSVTTPAKEEMIFRKKRLKLASKQLTVLLSSSFFSEFHLAAQGDPEAETDFSVTLTDERG